MLRAIRALDNIIEPPTNQVWGHRTLFFKDPEGTLLEIYANV